MKDKEYEKKPLQSKKFLAFVLTEILGILVVCLILLKFELGAAQTGIIITALIIRGFVASGFIIGQSSLDRYVRIAEITTNQASQGDKKDE